MIVEVHRGSLSPEPVIEAAASPPLITAKNDSTASPQRRAAQLCSFVVGLAVVTDAWCHRVTVKRWIFGDPQPAENALALRQTARVV